MHDQLNMCRMRSDEFGDKRACYFITFQTVDWIDIFIRPVYKQVIVHTLNHFIDSKGLELYAWCLMPHHLHLLARADNGPVIAEVEKEYKTFTTTKILEAIDTEPAIRKEWMMERFENFGNKMGSMKKYHVWQNCSNPLYIDLEKKDILLEHFEHIHQNPVRDRVVDTPSEYLYSSARDYTGMKGLVNITKLPAIEQQLAAAENMNGSFLVKYIRN
jgi:putative transposase